MRERAPDDAALQTRFSAYLAAAHSTVGALDQSRSALGEAVQAVRSVPVPQARTRVYWIKAFTLWLEGESDAGLAYIRRAIGLLEASEDTVQLARAHVLVAQMLNMDGRYGEAAESLEKADGLFEAGADPSDLGIVRAEQAKVAAHEGDAEQAFRYAEEARALVGEDADLRSNVLHALALAHVAAGNVPEAEQHFRETLDELERKRQWREGAQVARQWADLLRSHDRLNEALDVMEQATVFSARQFGRTQRRLARNHARQTR